MEYTQEELDALLKAVTEEFEQMQKAEAEEKEKSKTASETADSTKSQSAKPAEEMKKEESKVEDSPKKEDSQGPKTQDPMPEVSVSGSGSDTTTSSSSESSGSESSVEGSEHSEEELEKLYKQLDKDSLKAHINAAVCALADKVADEGMQDPLEGSAPLAAPPAEMAAPAPQAPVYKNEAGEVITKAEIAEADAFVKNIQAENEKLKQEQEKAKTEQNLLKYHVQALEEKLTEVTVKLEKSIKIPQARKVFTGDDVIAKTETVTQMSTEQIFQKLMKKAEDPNITQADRDRIDFFAMNPSLTPELKEFLSIK